MLGVVFGKRSATKILKLLEQVKAQLQDRVPRLVTSDEFPSYATVLKQIWSQETVGKADKRCTRRKRMCNSSAKPDPTLNYATVCKQREDGHVVSVETTVVYGTAQSVAQALQESKVSDAINTSFLERHNGTDRHRNARKARRTYRFSKDWLVHQAVGYFTMYTYNFCWCVRTLAEQVTQGQMPAGGTGIRWRPRTPAMAAGLTDHVWSLGEWLAYPIAGLSN